MKTKKTIWKRAFLTISLFLFLALMLPVPALAQGIPFDDKVEEGETLEQNLILRGPVVEMDGVVNGDLVAIGDEVTINGEVDGSLITAGNRVVLNGPVSGNAVISAVTLVLGPEASIGRDLYFTGARVQTQDGSTINRDLNVVSLESALAGSVSRDVNTLVGPLNLIQVVLDYMESRGWIPESGFLDNLGRLRQPLVLRVSPEGSSQQAVSGMAFGLPALQNLRLISTQPLDVKAPYQGSTIDVERLKSWAIPFLRNMAALLILGLLAAWLIPMQLSWTSQQPRLHPWRALFTGLLVLVVGWISVVLVFVLVIALAFFLLWVSLPNLGFLIGTIGLSALGLAVSVFWLSIVFFSKLVVAAMIGTWLFNRFNSKLAQSRIWPVVVGVILYALLASIPYLGGLVATIATLLGLGALWMVATQRGGTGDLPGMEPTFAAENPGLSSVS